MKKVILYLFIVVILLIVGYLGSYIVWRNGHLVSFADYPGNWMQLSPKINKNIYESTILPKLTRDEVLLFKSFYGFDTRANAYTLKKIENAANSDRLVEILKKADFRDETPFVIYVSVNEFDQPSYRIFGPLIELDCTINKLTVASE